jgi:hypothetical protein
LNPEIDGGWKAAFAGKPAPTGLLVGRKILVNT